MTKSTHISTTQHSDKLHANKLHANEIQANEIQANEIKANEITTDTLTVKDKLTMKNNVSDTVKKIVENATLEELTEIFTYAVNKAKSIHTKTQQVAESETAILYNKEILLPTYSTIVQLKCLSVEIKDAKNKIYNLTIDPSSIFSHTFNNFLNHSNNNKTYFDIAHYPNTNITKENIEFKYFCVESGLIGPGVIQFFTENNTYNVHIISRSQNTFTFQLLKKCFVKQEDKDKDNSLDVSEFNNKNIRLSIPKSIYNSGNAVGAGISAAIDFLMVIFA